MIDWLLTHYDSFITFVESLGWAGPGVFLVTYIILVMTFLPITPFSIAAGALFGWFGVVLSVAGGWIGAMLSFWIARYFGYDYFCRKCEENPTLKAMDRAMRSSGWWGVLLIRISGLIPYAMQNYALGVTRIRNRDYALGSFLGLFPGGLAKVWIGVTAGDVMVATKPISNERWFLIAFGIIASLLMLLYFTRLMKREFEKLSKEETETKAAQ